MAIAYAIQFNEEDVIVALGDDYDGTVFDKEW